MKQHRILSRVLSVLFCLALCTQLTGCVQIPIPTLKPTPAPTPTPDKTYNDSLITEAYSVEGSFTDEYEETWDYAYHIPQLAADTVDAAAINAEIVAYFGSDARAAQEGITAEGSRYINWLNVSWESHWSGSLLSLSLCAASWLGDMGGRYFVYHYDFAAGQKLTNAQVLDRVGVREADFTTALRRAAAQTFDAMYAPWGVNDIGPEDETFPSACIELAALRARTVQERNTGLETAVFYPNGDGTFTAYQPVGMVAGAGWYDREMTVKPGASEWATAKAPSSAYGFVSAALTGDGASVRITKGKDGFFDSETYRKSFGFSYDTEYPIAGCYGDYQDIFVGVCGQELYPYAFLLTKGNTVEYADIFGGLGCGALSCGGPLYGLRDIVRFESGICADEHGGGYETVYAVDKSGAKYDLAQRIVPMSSTMSTGVTGDWYADVHHGGEGSGYTDRYALSIQSDGFTDIQNTVEGLDDPITYSGYGTYLGTTEQGMLYRFQLRCGDRSCDATFAFALDFSDSWDGTLIVTTVAGVDLFDAGEGGSTVFTRGA